MLSNRYRTMLAWRGCYLMGNTNILIRGKLLNEFKLQFAPVINVGSKTTQLGLYNFRSVLNLAMLRKESAVDVGR